MIYSQLGSSGVKVSAAGLGTWTTFGDSVDEKECLRMVARAIDLGCNFFDTADSYAGGRAELVLGEALANTARDDLVLSTKVFFPRRPGPLNAINHRLSRKNILRSVETSLTSLRTEYVDLLLLHRYDETQDLDEVADALSVLINGGKTLYWGVSKWPSSALRVLNDKMPPGRRAVAYQGLHNILHRDDFAAVRAYLKKARISFHAYSPLARGVLTGKYMHAIPEGSRMTSTHRATVYDIKDQQKTLPRLKDLARTHNLNLLEVALGFCSTTGCDAVVLGASNASQFEQLWSAIERVQSEDIAAQVRRVMGDFDNGLDA